MDEFSPSQLANVLETTRIPHFFWAELILFHVGSKTEAKRAKIDAVLSKIEHRQLPIEIQWKSGNLYEVISNARKTAGITF